MEESEKSAVFVSGKCKEMDYPVELPEECTDDLLIPWNWPVRAGSSF